MTEGEGALSDSCKYKLPGKTSTSATLCAAMSSERLRTIAQRYFEGAVRSHVTVEKQRSSFITDCTLHLATGLVLQAHGTAGEAFASFEAAATHLEKQLRRYK